MGLGIILASKLDTVSLKARSSGKLLHNRRANFCTIDGQTSAQSTGKLQRQMQQLQPCGAAKVVRQVFSCQVFPRFHISSFLISCFLISHSCFYQYPWPCHGQPVPIPKDLSRDLTCADHALNKATSLGGSAMKTIPGSYGVPRLEIAIFRQMFSNLTCMHNLPFLLYALTIILYSPLKIQCTAILLNRINPLPHLEL